MFLFSISFETKSYVITPVTVLLYFKDSLDFEKPILVDNHFKYNYQDYWLARAFRIDDGHSENIYNSFTNESNANQVEWNDMSSSLPDTYDAPNPEDNLRDLMGAEEYADLMEETDTSLAASPQTALMASVSP